jgi:hypothetical protein
MNYSNPCKKVTFNYPYGIRRIGRPPIRWLHDVEMALKTTKAINRKMKALDRTMWGSIIGAVLA